MSSSPAAEVDGRLADASRQRAHADDVVQPCVLEHDDGGHELRDARDRAGLRRVATREDGAVLAHEVPRSGRDLRRGGSIGARSLNGRREDGDESDDGEQCSAHQRSQNYSGVGLTSPPQPTPRAASRCASAAAAARQSASVSRYA